MRKIVLLFLGALFSFFAFSYIDEYENLILPFFTESTTNPTPPKDFKNRLSSELKDTIVNFNASLSKAYLEMDPSLLSSNVDKGLMKSIAGEIRYLAREGKIMDIKVVSLKIEKIEALSASMLSLETKETVKLRYLALPDRRESVAYPPAIFNMRYSLARSGSEWRILSSETVLVDGQK